MTDTKKVKFSAVLSPNRSLTPTGFVIIMSVVALVSFAAGIMFVRMGAWPVFGFFGLDAALLYWAFKRNFADSEQREIVEVTDHELLVQRWFPKQPVEEHRFLRHWVRINLAEDKARELIGCLTVHSHGKSIEIASFLGGDERKEFYQALSAALNKPVTGNA